MQVGEKGVAVGIDHIDELVQLSVDNIKKSPETLKLLNSGQLQLVVGDGRLGHDKFAPYDAIHVGAAAPEIPKAVSRCLVCQDKMTTDEQIVVLSLYMMIL